MENATKALTIAGGVLIAVMLAVLVTYVFTHWGNSQKMQQEEIDIQRTNDFNKSYLSYEKVLYGSELLGLANKISDYNDGDDVNYSGYGKMGLSIKIVELSGSTDNLFSRGTYNLNSINSKIQDVLDETTNSSDFKGKVSDSQWETLAKASSSSQESFNEICEDIKVNTSLNKEKLRDAAKEYYKYIQFKRMKFKHTGTTFFDNGRVKDMSFEETR